MAGKSGGPHILYLTHDGLTDPLGQSQILPYLTRLSARGFRFTIISFEKSRQRHQVSAIQEICDKAGIRWIQLAYHRKPPLIAAWWGIRKLHATALRLFKDDPYELVHCRSYVTSLVGLSLRKSLGIKYLFDMRGFWPDERIEGGIWVKSNPLHAWVYNYFKKREKAFLQSADHTVTLTEASAVEIRNWKIAHGPVSVIPTCVDLELFNPEAVSSESRNVLRSKMKLAPDDFVLVYSGSWGTWYLTREMLACFAALKRQKSNARLLILTPDHPQLDSFEYAADVRVTSVSRAEMPSWLSACDAAIMFIKPSWSKKASAATKFAEVAAMNVQVVANVGWGDMDRYARWIHSPGNFSVEAYDKLWASFRPAEGLRQFATEHFALTSGVAKYAGVYEALGLTVTKPAGEVSKSYSGHS